MAKKKKLDEQDGKENPQDNVKEDVSGMDEVTKEGESLKDPLVLAGLLANQCKRLNKEMSVLQDQFVKDEEVDVSDSDFNVKFLAYLKEQAAEEVPKGVKTKYVSTDTSKATPYETTIQEEKERIRKLKVVDISKPSRDADGRFWQWNREKHYIKITDREQIIKGNIMVYEDGSECAYYDSLTPAEIEKKREEGTIF